MPNATIDIVAQIFVAIANGLVNDVNWPVTQDNFIRYDNIEGIQTADKPVTTGADYPQAVLRGPITGKTDLQTGTETFGTHSSAGCDWLETAEFVFQLTITSDLMRLKNYSPQTMESVNAVRRLGAKLGLSYVTGVATKWTERETDLTEEDGVRRIETTINITVTTQYDGQSLTGGL